jgi:hypothetical protein
MGRKPREKMSYKLLERLHGQKVWICLAGGKESIYKLWGIAIASVDGEAKEDAKLQWTSVATKEFERIEG